jgi:hypothetical protein
LEKKYIAKFYSKKYLDLKEAKIKSDPAVFNRNVGKI